MEQYPAWSAYSFWGKVWVVLRYSIAAVMTLALLGVGYWLFVWVLSRIFDTWTGAA